MWGSIKLNSNCNIFCWIEHLKVEYLTSSLLVEYGSPFYWSKRKKKIGMHAFGIVVVTCNKHFFTTQSQYAMICFLIVHILHGVDQFIFIIFVHLWFIINHYHHFFNIYLNLYHTIKNLKKFYIFKFYSANDNKVDWIIRLWIAHHLFSSL